MPGDDSAIAPEGQLWTPPVPKPSAAEEEAKAEERRLGSLTRAAGWPDFQERLKTRIMALRTLANVNLAGMSFEEIGQRTMAAHLAADALEAELVTVLAFADEIDKQEPPREA